MIRDSYSLERFLAVCVIAASFFNLVSCTADPPWNFNGQSNGQQIFDSATCPVIAGSYSNHASSASDCSNLDSKACKALTFYFFSAHVPEALGVSNYPTPEDDWPDGTQVTIVQPQKNVLLIESVLGGQGATSRVIKTIQLSRERGDFECEGSSIRLRPRIERDYALWFGRRTNTDYRSVSAEQDALTIESVRHYESYILWFVGGTMREEQRVMHWRKIK